MDRFLHGNGPFALSININSIKMNKEIQIRRKEKLSYLPPAVVAEAKKKLGSIYDGMAPLSGLTKDEEKKYLPGLLGVSPTSQDYERAVRAFWADFFVSIPADGVVLNIGLKEDGEPINVLDWVKYQWAIKHKFVAMSKEQCVADKLYYIHDPEAQIHKDNLQVNAKKLAYTEFIKLSDKPDTVNRLIRVLGKRNPAGMTPEMKENFLAQLVEKQPKQFYTIATDKNLDLQDMILHLTEVGIIQKIGHAYLYLDTEIGATLEEAIHFFRSKRNSQAVTEMKAKLKELDPSTAKTIEKAEEPVKAKTKTKKAKSTPPPEEEGDGEDFLASIEETEAA